MDTSCVPSTPDWVQPLFQDEDWSASGELSYSCHGHTSAISAVYNSLLPELRGALTNQQTAANVDRMHDEDVWPNRIPKTRSGKQIMLA